MLTQIYGVTRPKWVNVFSSQPHLNMMMNYNHGVFAAKSCVKQTWRTLVWYHKIHCFSVRTSIFISILPWNYVKFIFAIKLFQIKSNYTWINYSHDNIAIRSHMMIHNFVWNLILVANLIAFTSQKQKNVWVFLLSFDNLQRAKDGTHMLAAKYRYVFVAQISSNR